MELQYRGSGYIFFNETEYNCDLYYNEKQGGIILKVNIRCENTLGKFLELPLDIPFLCGQLNTGFKFTLVQLDRIEMQNLVSYRKAVYTFSANYILCGIGHKTSEEQLFNKVSFTLSNIIEWGEESVYTIGDNYELINKKDDICKLIYQDDNYSINYIVRGSMLPVVESELLTEQISLKQYGIIEISFVKEHKLETFLDVFNKLKRLIEIASFRKINVESVNAYSKDIKQTIGEQSVEYPIKIYGNGIEELQHEETSNHRYWKWIMLSELIANNSFNYYFEKHNKLAPIIELYLEPFYVNYNSETRVFLNIVQALETYHSRFVTNRIDDFKLRVDEITKKYSFPKADEVKKYLMAKSKGFVTLESRLADLLFANGNIYFDTGEIKHEDFPSIIAHTRNYYIHYDESIKDKHTLLLEEELHIYNRSLLQILEYYILLELGFSDIIEIKKKLIGRWGKASQSLDILRISKGKHKVS